MVGHGEHQEQSRLDASGIKWIFAGALFIILDFRVMGFDVIPDFVGCILILGGLRRLEVYSPLLRRGKIFAAVNLALSLTDFYSVEYPLGEAPDWLTTYALILAPIGLIFSLLTLYHILYGIADMARQARVEDLALRGRGVFAAKAVSGVMGSLSVMAGMLIPELAAPFVIPVIAVALVIEVFYLYFLYRAQKELHGRPI